MSVENMKEKELLLFRGLAKEAAALSPEKTRGLTARELAGKYATLCGKLAAMASMTRE